MEPVKIQAVLSERLRRECASLRASLDPLQSVRELPELTVATLARMFGAEAPPPSEFEKQWPSDISVSDAIDLVERHSAELADYVAQTLSDAVPNFVSTDAECRAVLSRIVEVWPWPDLRDFDSQQTAALSLLPALHRMRAALAGADDRSAGLLGNGNWPTDVALQDAANWVADRLTALKLDGKRYKAICYGELDLSEFDPSREKVSFREARLRQGSPWTISPAPFVLGRTLLSGQQLAWIYSMARAVEKDRAKPAVRMPANRYAQAVSRMIAAPASIDKPSAKWPAGHLSADAIVLDWGDKREPMQLHLLGDGPETLDETIVRSILSSLGGDALRDWIVIHQLAGEQGATGDFLWTWSEHKEKAGYAAQIRKSSRSEAELSNAARNRLFRLHKAELWAERPFVENGQTKIARTRIGPHGLISIGAEILKDDDQRATEVIAGRINPALYSLGPKKKGVLYTQLPPNISELPESELRVFLQLAYCWRSGAGEDRGTAALKAKTLWQYAGFSDEQIRDKRRWLRLRAQLERVLSTLAKDHGVQWICEGEGAFAKYTVHAPAWWKDRVVYGVKPQALSSTAHVPRTSSELEEMRRARGLSMRHLAEVVGVGLATISRRTKGSETLPADWLPKLSAAKLYKV